MSSNKSLFFLIKHCDGRFIHDFKLPSWPTRRVFKRRKIGKYVDERLSLSKKLQNIIQFWQHFSSTSNRLARIRSPSLSWSADQAAFEWHIESSDRQTKRRSRCNILFNVANANIAEKMTKSIKSVDWIIISLLAAKKRVYVRLFITSAARMVAATVSAFFLWNKFRAFTVGSPSNRGSTCWVKVWIVYANPGSCLHFFVSFLIKSWPDELEKVSLC